MLGFDGGAHGGDTLFGGERGDAGSGVAGCCGVKPRLRDLIDHHEDRMLAIEEACVKPQIAKDLLPVLFARELDSRQMMMALGEAIAHVHLLIHRNRLERNEAEDGVFRFRSVDSTLSRRAHPNDHEAPDDQPSYV